MTSGLFVTQPLLRQVSYKIEDFIPIATLIYEPVLLLATQTSGITDVESLINAQDISYGYPGAGGIPDLCAKVFISESGAKMNGVPYNGDAEVVSAMLGNHVQACVMHPSSAKQYIESGDLVPLGIFADERDGRDLLKDVPTIKEQGYDIDLSVWKFVCVPKDTTEDVVATLKDAFGKMIATDSYKEFLDFNKKSICHIAY